MRSYRRWVRLLFVCTGNLCRSPIAEQLLHAWAAEELGHSAPLVQVASAGTEAADGQPMDPRSAQAVAELGADPTGARARRLRPGDTADVDLVLTATRWHRRVVLELDPRALRRAFTLGEAARLLESADLTGLDLVPLEGRARELAVRLHAARSRRADVDDDVRDPIGQSLEVHREVAAEIAGLLRPLADVLFRQPARPPLPRRPAVVSD